MTNMREPLPGILNLILWKPSADGQDRRHAEALDLQPCPWSQLPEHLLHSILARLPFQSLLRFRSVSRDWKALFNSPNFHHLPSHAPHVPPWIFFLGTRSTRRPLDTDIAEERDSDICYDDGRDDNGFVFEGSEQGINDDDELDSLMSVCDDSVDTEDAMQHSEHGDISDAMMSAHDLGMDHVRYCDLVATQGANAGKDTRMNDSKPSEDLLLIFDCATESWRPPLVLPTGFVMRTDYTFGRNFFARFSVCYYQEYILIPTCCEITRYFLFNPEAPLCKELPPCVVSKDLEAVGFLVEMATPTRLNVAGDLSSLARQRAEQSNQPTTDRIMQVVVVGQMGDKYVVENFSSTIGSWSICGYLQHSDDLFFTQRPMMYYKGSFYGTTTKGLIKLNIGQRGQSMEYTFRELPVAQDDPVFDPPDVCLTEARLLATKDALYMVGITYTPIPASRDIEDWDILIWEHLPHAADDACWKFQARAPKHILDDYFGSIDLSAIDFLAHGDLVFLGIENRQRFLIYDLRTRVWRCSAKCKWYLGTMSFLWEPLLRSAGF